MNSKFDSSYIELVKQLDTLHDKNEHKRKEEKDTLKHFIKYSKQHWANPSNVNHDKYQRAMDRRFILFVYLFTTICIVAGHGWGPALAFNLGLVATFAVMLVTCVVIPLCSDLYGWFVDYFNGY